MRGLFAGWLIILGVLTLVWAVLAELAIRRGERRKHADEAVRKMTTLIIPYDKGCSPHPWPSEGMVWVSTDNAADAWAAIGGSAA